jgi:hypothetical protein
MTRSLGSSFEKLLNCRVPWKRNKEGAIRDIVLRDLENTRLKKRDLDRERYPPRVLKQILDLMVSWSYYREGQIEKFTSCLEQEGIDKTSITIGFLRTSKCEELLREFSNKRNNLVERVKKILIQLEGTSLRDWLKKRYDSRGTSDRSLKEINFGDKGIDTLLRDCGYFDRIPIDIHERRFQVRTGIFVYYSPNCNPAGSNEYQEYHEALTSFSRHELTGLKLSEYTLDRAPGIVDWAIWYFCSKKHGNICGDTPRCDICPLNHVCLFGIGQKNRSPKAHTSI